MVKMMRPQLSYLTLTVQDLARAHAFYHALFNWPSDGIVGTEYEHGAVVFYQLPEGLILALWPRASLAHETGQAAQPFTKVAANHGLASPVQQQVLLAHNLPSPAAVDQFLAKAQAQGASWVKPAAPTAWGGYAGYFADPDGNLWEATYNPKYEQQLAS